MLVHEESPSGPPLPRADLVRVTPGRRGSGSGALAWRSAEDTTGIGRLIMTERPEAHDAPDDEGRGRAGALPDLEGLERRELLAWVGEHLPYVRRTAFGQRPLYWILGIFFVVGLATHIGGYFLESSATSEPLGLVADLLYSFGFALWTGVVIVVFIQVIPEAKRRQFEQVLEIYETAQRDEARTEGDEAEGYGAPR
jgi:hypothetical protein